MHVCMYIYIYTGNNKCMYTHILICIYTHPHAYTHTAKMLHLVTSEAHTSESLGLDRYHCATHCNTLQHTATHCNTLHYERDMPSAEEAHRKG